MRTSGGYHEYIGRCSVHLRDIMICVGGYHEYIGGISCVHRGMFSTSEGIMIHVGEKLDKILSISIENSDVLNIPRCTHDIPPMYSRYPPRCTHGIPPMYSWYLPDVLMVSPDVLNIPRCTEHTLYRVLIWLISPVPQFAAMCYTLHEFG